MVDLDLGIEKLKKYKAAGFDSIINESVKHGGPNIKLALLKLFKRAARSVEAPLPSRSLVICPGTLELDA